MVIAPHEIREAEVRSILTPVSGFLVTAGFTHSLTPARNCTYGCTYCYVPAMGIYGGLKPEDWRRWGQFTTIKTNAAKLLGRELRAEQVIYCSPLVDPYQPAERERPRMPGLLRAVAERPPAVFTIQTRGPLILRDLPLLRELAERTVLRISFSVTTDRDDVRRRYEPHCESNQQRLETIACLREAGLEVYATLAPLLPCDPERLVRLAIEASRRNLIGDPLHTRQTKPRGATTRAAARQIAEVHGETEWFDAEYQARAVHTMEQAARALNHEFAAGTEGFRWLAQR